MKRFLVILLYLIFTSNISSMVIEDLEEPVTDYNNLAPELKSKVLVHTLSDIFYSRKHFNDFKDKARELKLVNKETYNLINRLSFLKELTDNINPTIQDHDKPVSKMAIYKAVLSKDLSQNEYLLSKIILNSLDLPKMRYKHIHELNLYGYNFKELYKLRLDMIKQLVIDGLNLDLQDKKTGDTYLINLHKRYFIGRNDIANILIFAGANLDIQNKDGKSAIYIESVMPPYQTLHDAMSNLIDAGANINLINKAGNSALNHHNLYGNYPLAQKLVKSGAILENRSLNCLFISGDRKTRKMIHKFYPAQFKEAVNGLKLLKLIKKSKKISDKQKIKINKLIPIANLNIRDKKNKTALIYATKNKNEDIALLLLKNGANSEDRALEKACKTGQVKLVNALVKEFENQKNYLTNILSPTIKKCSGFDNKKRIIKILLKAGANINKKMHNNITPLMLAVELKQFDTVEFLLDCGADINQPNIRDETPLFLAAEKNLPSMVELLLKNGAKPNIQNINGKIPLSKAREMGNTDIIKLLETNFQDKLLESID